MVGVRKALTAGLISSQVALSNSHTLILYLSQGIKMDQLAAHRRYCWDSHEKAWSISIFKSPIEFGISAEFFGEKLHHREENYLYAAQKLNCFNSDLSERGGDSYRGQ